MDDELLLLQQQLAAIQQQETSLKLSDHNIIDLLSKLQELFPPSEFQVIHTLNSTKQFLTPTRLMEEIQEHLLLYRGRISVNELAQLITVDRFYIEKYAAQLARDTKQQSTKSKSDKVFVVNGGEEVLTNGYLDAIMEETNALLQEKGTLTIGELAQQYDFAVDHMREVILARIGTILKAKEHQNCLVTETFVQSQKAKIRGLMCGITKPTFLPELARAYGLDDTILQQTVQELISTEHDARVVWGALRGKEYVPLMFLNKQKENLYSFFEQNGFIDQQRACDMLQVSRPFELLQKQFGKDQVIALKKSCVHASLKILLDGAVENASNDKTCCDLRTVMPSGLPPSDLETLIGQSPAIKKTSASSYAFVADSSSGTTTTSSSSTTTTTTTKERPVYQIHQFYAIAKEFLDAIMETLQQDAIIEASKAVQDHRSNVTSEVEALDQATENDHDDVGGPGRKGGGRKGGKSTPSSASSSSTKKNNSKRGGKKKNQTSDDEADDLDDDDQEERGKQKSKRKQKQASKKQQSTTSSGSSKRGPAKPVTRSIVPSRTRLLELFVQVHQELEDEDPELVDALVDFLEPETHRIYQEAMSKALSSILRGDAASLRELRKKFDDLFDDQLVILTIYEKAFLKLEHLLSRQVHAQQQELDQSLKQVEVFVLETCGVELSGLVMAFVMESYQLSELENCTLLSKVLDQADKPPVLMTRLSDTNKKLLEQQLQPAMASALVRMWTLSVAGRRSLGDFMVHLTTVLAPALNLPLHKMDRKKERQVVFGQRHLLVAALEQDEDNTSPKDQLVACKVSSMLQLFFQQVTGLCLTLPTATSSCELQPIARLVLTALERNVTAQVMDQMNRFVHVATSAGEEEQHDWSHVLDETKALVLSKDISKPSTSPTVDPPKKT